MKLFSTFRLGDQLFGVDVLQVREVNQQLDLTVVPLAAEHICGLINLRGQIVTVFDLGTRIGREARDIGRESHVVVLKTDDELAALRARTGRTDLGSCHDAVGLLVDAVGDVVEVDETDIEPPPANLHGVDSRYLNGVVKLEQELLTLLDVKELVAEQ